MRSKSLLATPASASTTSTRETTPASYCARVWSSRVRLLSRLLLATRSRSSEATSSQYARSMPSTVSIKPWRKPSSELPSAMCVVFTASHGWLQRKSLRSGRVTLAVSPAVYWGESAWMEEFDSRAAPVYEMSALQFSLGMTAEIPPVPRCSFSSRKRLCWSVLATGVSRWL